MGPKGDIHFVAISALTHQPDGTKLDLYFGGQN